MASNPQYTTVDMYEELRACLRHFDAIHRSAEDARARHAGIERQVNEIRRAYTDKLHAQIATSPEFKVKFSNKELREAEVQRRLEADIHDMLQQEQEAREIKNEATAELERSAEALKTYRALTGLVESEKRLEAVTMDVASMPRMVRR